MLHAPGVGARVGPYRLRAVLGRGGMGQVFVAEDEERGERCALKLLDPVLAHDPRARQRFEHEWRTLATLRHPHVVRVLGGGEEQGVAYLAMELVPGTDLGVLLEREGPLDPRRTVELAAQVASALDAAHAFGLVHRDVKPSNVLVAPGDRVKVADFGIAKRLGEPSALTATGFLGSVDYAAPEQVAQGDVDARTDVYALGCLVFHCLTGRPPFARATQLDTLNAQMTAPPPRVSSAARGGLPGAVDAVLARALAKVPGRRQRSCGELVAQLAAALEPAPRREPRRLALAGAGAVAVALVLGGAALAILPSEAPERPAPPPASTSAPPPRPAGQRAEVAWSERSGRAWQAFAGAWSEGWDTGCERVFDDAGAELLEVQGSGVRMTLQECREARPASPAGGVPEAPPGDPREAGLASGARAGCEHVFTLAPQVETADGLDVVDDSMCN